MSRAVLVLVAVLAAPVARAEEAPLTPGDVVARAVAANPTLRAALLDLRRARLAVEAEEARYTFDFLATTQVARAATPTLGLGGVFTADNSTWSFGTQVARHLKWGTDLSLRLDTSADLAATTSPAFAALQSPVSIGPAFGVALTLQASQPLLRGAGALVGEAELRAARAQQTSAERARDRVASGLLRDVLTAYWELWYADEALVIERSSLEVAREQQADAAARARLGALAPAEVLQFDTRVASLEEQVTLAETDRQRRGVELLRLLGKGDAAAPVSTVREAPPSTDAPDRGLLALVEDVSPDVGEAKAAIDLARVQAETAGEPLSPRLDLTGTVKVQGLGNDDVGAAFEQLGTFGAVTALVGLTYEMPLDDARREAELASARVAIQAAEERLRERVQSVEAQLATALAQDDSARRRIELAERTVSIAEQQVKADEARFATGSATALQVAQAEDQLRAAQLRLARARVDLALAHLLITHLTGGLLAEANAVE